MPVLNKFNATIFSYHRSRWALLIGVIVFILGWLLIAGIADSEVALPFPLEFVGAVLNMVGLAIFFNGLAWGKYGDRVLRKEGAEKCYSKETNNEYCSRDTVSNPFYLEHRMGFNTSMFIFDCTSIIICQGRARLGGA